MLAVTSALILRLKELCDFGLVGGGVFDDDTDRFTSCKVGDPSDPGNPGIPGNPSDPGDPGDPGDPSDPGDPLCSLGLAGVVVICDTAGYPVEVVAELVLLAFLSSIDGAGVMFLCHTNSTIQLQLNGYKYDLSIEYKLLSFT